MRNPLPRLASLAILVGLAVLLPLSACSKSGSASNKSLSQRIAEGDSSALGALRAKGAAAIPQLIELMKDPNPDVVVNAVMLVGMLGDAGKPAVPTLIQAMKVPGVKGRAMDALASLRRVATPDMVTAFDSGDDALKKLIVESWSHGVGGEAKDAVPGLTKYLSTSDSDARVWAAMALANIGSAAKSALPALHAAAEAAPEKDKRMFAGVIKRIEDSDKPGMYSEHR